MCAGYKQIITNAGWLWLNLNNISVHILFVIPGQAKYIQPLEMSTGNALFSRQMLSFKWIFKQVKHVRFSDT